MRYNESNFKTESLRGLGGVWMNKQSKDLFAVLGRAWRRLCRFGSISLESLFKVLFIAGLCFPLMGALALGNWAYRAVVIMREVSEGVQVGTNSLPLGVLVGLIAFAVGAVLWRVGCELLFIVFKRIQGK